MKYQHERTRQPFVTAFQRRSKQIIGSIAALALLTTGGAVTISHPTFAEDVVVAPIAINFEDANLCDQTISQIRIVQYDPPINNCSDSPPSIIIYETDIYHVSFLRFERYQADDPIITSLVGLERFLALSTLEINDHQVSDLTPLANLVNFQSIYAQNNQISDLTPLTDLADLFMVAFDGNHISDITPLLAHNIPFTNYGGDWYGGFSMKNQTSTDTTNSEVYELPSLYQAANSTLEIPSVNGWAEAVIPGVLELENATMNPDGRSITITDLSRPAVIRIADEGPTLAAGSTHTVTYATSQPEPEPEPEPGNEVATVTTPDEDSPVDDSTIATPNTGTSTETTVNSTALSCIIAAITTALFFSIRHLRRQNRHQSDPLLEVPNQFRG